MGPRTCHGKRELTLDPVASQPRPVLPQGGGRGHGMRGQAEPPYQMGQVEGTSTRESGRKDYRTGPQSRGPTGSESDGRHGCGAHRDDIH